MRHNGIYLYVKYKQLYFPRCHHHKIYIQYSKYCILFENCVRVFSLLTVASRRLLYVKYCTLSLAGTTDPECILFMGSLYSLCMQMQRRQMHYLLKVFGKSVGISNDLNSGSCYRGKQRSKVWHPNKYPGSSYFRSCMATFTFQLE